MKKMLFLVIGLFSTFGSLNYAAASSNDACRFIVGEAKNSVICQKTEAAEKKIVPKVIETIAWVVGVLSVIMIIWGGIRYTISAGDSSKIARAKTILIYSIVGLVISILAGVIVNFVVNNL